ncbi:MAG: patatin-like phospholipase family protein [Bacillota bacterium]|nr:patatin-like phospholipase family protein [Bacillota bacterium]
MQKKGGLGLALAGGGIRGFSQLGILKVLEKNKIKADFITGTSIGSIVAALYSCGLSSDEIYKHFSQIENKFKESNAFSRPSFRLLPFGKNSIDGFIDADIIEKESEEIFESIGITNIKEVKVPLSIPSVDINSSRIVLFTSSPESFAETDDYIIIDDIPLSLVVRASSSIPIAMSTREYKGMRLADGGLRMNVPIHPLRQMGADRVLAVTMNSWHESRPKNLIELSSRSIDIILCQQTDLLSTEAELCINVAMPNINSLDLGKGHEAYECGYKTALENESAIVKMAKPKFNFFGFGRYDFLRKDK